MQNCGENGAAERMCRRKLAGLSKQKWRFSSPLWVLGIPWRDVENEQGVRRSESSGTAAAAKPTTTMAAPTSEEDTSEGPEGGNSGSSNGNSGRGRRRGSTGRQTGGVPTESGRRVGAGCKNRVRGGGGEG